MSRVYFVSLGCAKNQVDTEVMLGAAVSGGHELVTDPARAEVIVVNTCGFIGPAKEESIDTVLEMARYKEASIEYLEALKLADSMVVAHDLSDEIRQLYEPILEAQSALNDEGSFKILCDNVHKMLMRADWREHLVKAREQLPRAV